MDLIAQVQAANRLPTPDLARAIRVAAGVTQAQLARELGVHTVTVARWESGARHPRSDLRARYSGLLDALQGAINGAT